MMMYDNLFGELEYNYGWYGNTTISFSGKKTDIKIYIKSENETETITDEQREAYQNFISSFSDIQGNISYKIYEYYKKIFSSLDDDIVEKGMSKNIREFLDTIKIYMIVVGYQIQKHEISILFECDWDEENGVGVLMYGTKIENIGYISDVL